jgi:hypothetical protein
MIDGFYRECAMAWFRNQYLCNACNCNWQDEWSATCDDDCPYCGTRHMAPYDSVDLTEIIEESNGKFLIYRSPASAEDSASYELIAACDSREAAAKFLMSDGLETERTDGPVSFVD